MSPWIRFALLALVPAFSAPALAAPTPVYHCTDDSGGTAEVRVTGDEAHVSAAGQPEQVLVRNSPNDAFRKAFAREQCWDDGCEHWNEDHRFAPRDDGSATLALEKFSTCKMK